MYLLLFLLKIISYLKHFNNVFEFVFRVFILQLPSFILQLEYSLKSHPFFSFKLILNSNFSIVKTLKKKCILKYYQDLKRKNI